MRSSDLTLSKVLLLELGGELRLLLYTLDLELDLERAFTRDRAVLVNGGDGGSSDHSWFAESDQLEPFNAPDQSPFLTNGGETGTSDQSPDSLLPPSEAVLYSSSEENNTDRGVTEVDGTTESLSRSVMDLRANAEVQEWTKVA